MSEESKELVLTVLLFSHYFSGVGNREWREGREAKILATSCLLKPGAPTFNI
jgi:hypothetical protein